MKKETTRKNPYATNKGGKIESPTPVGTGDPKATKTVGDDLRSRPTRK